MESVKKEEISAKQDFDAMFDAMVEKVAKDAAIKAEEAKVEFFIKAFVSNSLCESTLRTYELESKIILRELNDKIEALGLHKDNDVDSRPKSAPVKKFLR